jgi:omega-hydroxy-beta-dihydromenaquinone-9 sulfotransferase
MPPAPNRKDEWSPRLWEGMDFIGWLRLLARNRFAVEPKYWYIAGIVSAMSVLHMVLRLQQQGRFGDRIAATPIPLHPIFVIGHWRTGTTLLHELMILDERFSYPDTYACLEPNHTLLTEQFVKRYMSWLVPRRRPMDNMAVGFDRPQEDEFALCMMGEPTTYTDFAFPNRPPLDPGALDLRGLSSAQLAKWKRSFHRFLQMLTFKDPRRLVLKSPPHTARIPILLEMFPDARFIHIMRDPFVVFISTLNLWKSLARKHGLQTPRSESTFREKVFREFRVIYDRLEEAKPLIPAGRFHELKYELLVKDPVNEMGTVFAGVGLDGFDAYRPKLDEYLARTAGYETNKFQISDADRADARRRWGDIIDRYGYG